MYDFLDEIVEKTETGYNLVVTQENRNVWIELIRSARNAACRRYKELYSGADLTAQIWIEGFQTGYIGGCIGALLNTDQKQQMDLEGQVEKILREFEFN